MSEKGGTLERPAPMANHFSDHAAHDRRSEEMTLDEVERVLNGPKRGTKDAGQALFSLFRNDNPCLLTGVVD